MDRSNYRVVVKIVYLRLILDTCYYLGSAHFMVEQQQHFMNKSNLLTIDLVVQNVICFKTDILFHSL